MKKDNRVDLEQDEVTLSMREFLKLCLGQWKWFVISVVCFGLLGVFYAARKQQIFSREMELLVKNQDAGGGMSDISNAFSSLGLFSSNTSVYNELISFTSPAVMKEVVERLDLTMNYNLRKGLHPNTLYGTNCPVVVKFTDLGEQQAASFRLKLYPNGDYTLYKMVLYGPTGKEKYSGEINGRLQEAPVKTALGGIIIRANDAHIPPADKEEMTIDVFKQGLQATIESYNAKLKGDLTDQDADVIKLSIEDPSKERADDILLTVLDVYNERYLEDKNKIAVATSKFISDRLEVISKELGQVDQEITDFKASMKVPDLQTAAQGYMEQDFKMTEEQLKVSNMLAMTTYLKDYLQNSANSYSILPMITGTENAVLEAQIGKYNELLLQRNNLSENSSDLNPLVKDLNKELSGLRNAILQSVNSQIANLNNTLKNISKAQDNTKGELASSPYKANTILSAERQQLVMQQLYLYLLQKREETELTKTFSADNIRVITPPYGSKNPVAPKTKLIIIIAVLLGVGIPAVAMFISESSNTKIRSKKDIESLSVPFAGEIPFIGKKGRVKKLLSTKKGRQKALEHPKVVVVEGKRDIPNEAFRVVRSNLDFMLGKESKSVIALTSFNPASGKSFVAYNLGRSFALKGKRVLLIDGDLRHGSLSAYVNCPGKGLTGYLNGSFDHWEGLVKSIPDFKGLDVLPIGHRPPNPAELLDNGKIDQLLKQAKSEYDVVLIDCPPYNVVVDTQIINQYVDRTLFIIRAGLLERSALADLMNIVEEKKLKNITVLLNGTDTNFSSYHTFGNYEAIDSM